MKILLVDDEEELASTLAERLQIRGIDAQWAVSAEQALQRLDAETFDLAVLDIKMPRTDGLKLKLQMQARNPAMRFIFVTGHGSNRDFETGASEVGADYYLIKPLNIDELVAKIKEALQR